MLDNHPTQPDNSRRKDADFHFEGFRSPTTTAIPDEFFDVLAPRLSEAELRVLLYIMRRTFGFKKQSDAISLGQMTDGIRCKDGRVLDEGTGMSKPSVLRGINGLVEKGIIWMQKHTDSEGRSAVNLYGLCFANTQINQHQSDSSNGYSSDEYSAKNQTLATDNYQDKDGIVTQSYHLTQPQPIGVKQSYHKGKAKLPSTVTQHDKGSNAPLSEVVTQHDPQHDRLTNYSSQETDNNKRGLLPNVNLTAGNLAIAALDQNEALTKEFGNFGLDAATITRLCQKHSADYLAEKIKLVRRKLNNGSVKNPAGLLLWAIENDYQGSPTVGSPLTSPSFEGVLAYVSGSDNHDQLADKVAPIPPQTLTGLQPLKKKSAPRRSEAVPVGRAVVANQPRPPIVSGSVAPLTHSNELSQAEAKPLLERLRHDLTTRLNETQTALYLAEAVMTFNKDEVLITTSHPLYSRRITPAGRSAIEYSLGQLLKRRCFVRFT